MAAPEMTPSPAPSAIGADVSRNRSFRLVLIGLIIAIVGFTAALLANGLYPCVPAAGSQVEPPLTDCAAAVSPWVGVAIVGLVLALVGYRRAG